jgi:hypothetical protein
LTVGAVGTAAVLGVGVAVVSAGALQQPDSGGVAVGAPSRLPSPPPGTVTTDTPVSDDSYVLLDNRTLRVQVAVGGGCQETGSAAGVVGEGVDTVRIRVTVTRRGRTPVPGVVCPLNLILQNVDLHLTQNLGGREVVDEVGDKTLRRAPGDGTGVKAPAAATLARTDEFGIVTRISGEGSDLQVSVDRVDMLTGDEAAAAARAAGADEQLDYYLRNDNPLLRTYRVDPHAVVWGSIRMGLRQPWPQRTTLSRWRTFVASHLGQQLLFHFMIENGVITGIEEQYLP